MCFVCFVVLTFLNLLPTFEKNQISHKNPELTLASLEKLGDLATLIQNFHVATINGVA